MKMTFSGATHSTAILVQPGYSLEQFWRSLRMNGLTPEEFREAHPDVPVIRLTLHCGCMETANTLPELEAYRNVQCEHGNVFVQEGI